MQRLFVSPEQLHQKEVTLTGDLAHRIYEEFGLGEGYRIVLLDNSGWEYQVELELVTAREATGQIVKRSLVRGEPRTKVALYQGILARNAFEWILQAGTELGLVEFVPIISERCAIGTLDELRQDFEDWSTQITRAAETSQRGHLPKLTPAVLFDRACDQAGRRGLSLLLWSGGERTIRQVLERTDPPPFSVNLFVAPEEGFTHGEIERAEGYGVTPVSLGSRPLRPPGAALIAATAIFYELDDLV